jgi:murein DD-endopeptidase MepM/ murein hydrolase activator NlpD
MSLEGSQIPAEARIGQIMTRIDRLSGDEAGTQNLPVSDKQAQNFQAMVSMMQSQMYGDALNNPDDKDSDNSMMMGMNPMMSGMMPGMMGGDMNSMMAAMMGGGNVNPMSGMMGMGFNPAMMKAQSSYQRSPTSGPQEVLFPLKGQISSEYGERTHPITGDKHFHSGVDIAAPKGSPIRMPYDGKVVYVGQVDGFGKNTVIVAHENQVQPDGKILYSIFGHNDNVFVNQGEYIKQGDIVASVGSDGHSTGPHLHWETRVAPVGLAGREVFNRNLSMTINPMTLA